MSLPELPDPTWKWEAKVDAVGQRVTVRIVIHESVPHIASGEMYDRPTVLAERTNDYPTYQRNQWAAFIEDASHALWEDMSEAAKASVDLGIWVEVV